MSKTKTKICESFFLQIISIYQQDNTVNVFVGVLPLCLLVLFFNLFFSPIVLQANSDNKREYVTLHSAVTHTHTHTPIWICFVCFSKICSSSLCDTKYLQHSLASSETHQCDAAIVQLQYAFIPPSIATCSSCLSPKKNLSHTNLQCLLLIEFFFFLFLSSILAHIHSIILFYNFPIFQFLSSEKILHILACFCWVMPEIQLSFFFLSLLLFFRFFCFLYVVVVFVVKFRNT